MQTRYGHCLFLRQRSCLVVSILRPLDDKEFKALGMQVTEWVVQHQPSSAVLNLSGLDVVDSYSVKNLQRLCGLLDLHAVTAVITGIRPAIAICMAIRGLSFCLKNVSIAMDLGDALTMLDNSEYELTPDSSYPSLH